MRTFTPASRLGRALLWLLVVFIPLQGLSAGVMMAWGPSHTHVLASAVASDLVDVRRVSVVTRVREVHVATAFGHFHGTVSARHYHPRNDSSVVLDDAGALQHGDDNASSIDAASLLFATLLPNVPAYTPVTARGPAASHQGWPSLTHSPSLPERPPRGA